MVDQPFGFPLAQVREPKWYSAHCHSENAPMEVMNPLRRRRGSSATTLVLLFLALATVFLLGGSRDQPSSLRTSAAYHYSELTRNHMIVALNMAPEHGFLGFYRLARTGDDDLAYVPYNRFPVLGYALIKLATLPFPNDFSARLSAARTLMLVFFAAAAMLAYLALCRLTGSRWTALAATLLAFSSYYALFHSDMVATEVVVDLFGTMLVLHGIAVFATDGRFGQLLAKTCAALLLGWHVYALLLPFVLLGLAAALRSRDGQGVRRHLTLGAVAFAFGTLLLAANFAREYVALGGEVAATQMPSVESMLMRFGLTGLHGGEASAGRPAPPEHVTAWPVMVAVHLKRIAWSVPYAVGHFFGVGRPVADLGGMRTTVVLGVVVLAALVVATTSVLLLSPATRHRVPLAALALSAPCWAFAVHNQSWHPFEGLFGVGVPLVFFALALPRLDRLLPGRAGFSLLAGVAAVPTFALSSFLMARAVAADPEEELRQRGWAADVDAIREQVEEGKTIAISERIDGCSVGHYFKWKFYFTGYASARFSHRRLADFVVSGQRIEGAHTLTPDNRFMFLYDRASHAAALSRYERHAKQAVPVLDAPDYDVHLIEGAGGKELLYFRDQCPNHEIYDRQRTQHILMGGGRVFAHVWPADANDLPAARRPFGFDALVDFQESLPGWRKGGKCYAVCRLPDYDIAKIRIGAVADDWTSQGVAWEGGFSLEPAGGEAPGSAAAADEPGRLPSLGTDAGTHAPRVQVEEEARAL